MPVGLIESLREQGLTLCLAESCTGGGMASTLTAEAGASDVFLGGVVAYHDGAKADLLGVPRDALQQFGAVSGAVVEAMAHGARDRFGADMAIAISGIAGPDGGRPGKPVGTVWIAVLGPGHLMDVRRIHAEGERLDVCQAAIDEALAMARESVAEMIKEA